jgi:hypothetical protein
VAPAASKSSSDNQISLLTYAVVGGLMALLLVVVAVTRIQVYRARRKPVDMTALQDEIRASLGMTTAMNVNAGEMGLTMTFGTSIASAFEGLDRVHAEARARDLSDGLLTELRKQSGLPQRLSEMLNQNTTTVSVDVASATALVVMKRPLNGTLKADSEDEFAFSLQQRANNRKIVVNGEHAVAEVSVAVPRRVPRELDRHSFLRLGVLGEGFFGEVCRFWNTACDSVATGV